MPQLRVIFTFNMQRNSAKLDNWSIKSNVKLLINFWGTKMEADATIYDNCKFRGVDTSPDL